MVSSCGTIKWSGNFHLFSINPITNVRLASNWPLSCKRYNFKCSLLYIQAQWKIIQQQCSTAWILWQFSVFQEDLIVHNSVMSILNFLHMTFRTHTIKTRMTSLTIMCKPNHTIETHSIHRKIISLYLLKIRPISNMFQMKIVDLNAISILYIQSSNERRGIL